MLLRRLYYIAKPLVPWRARIAVRRLSARRLRRQHAGVWPIDPAAAARPAKWQGWPEGKKFAFVLTHDVERPEGVAKCRSLAALEAGLGFRSSFNFIPEGGDYSVEPALRAELIGQGFEVGVHDHRHDGKLFQSQDSFRAAAPTVNRYLQEWDAVGFRAGFMFHQLDWIRSLDVEYDASTFDTDPFEPQPDAAATIFPFAVPAAADGSRPGYVELPYTLAQDSTLFLLFQEKSPEIWLRKLDWVAEHGGMALVNVHPDYVCFEGERPAARTFPARHYQDLLSYVSSRYAGAYWQPLPRDLARWYKASHGLQ